MSAATATGSQAQDAASARNTPLVRLRNLTKKFGRKRALGGIDLDLDANEIVGFVGPDGAGKTTLIRSLAGLLDIEAREATVLGYDLRGDVTELKAHIGYVPQTFSLHRSLTVMENLRFTARLHRIDTAIFDARVRELLERTGLTPFTGRLTGNLSGGMKQKLAVANALLPEPRLLLLDEPTAGVDVVARGEIRSMLERQRSRALIIMSTAYIDEATACDRLVYLDEGRVVTAGTPAELRTRAALEMYRAWGADPRTIARLAKALPYVVDVHAAGGCARIEVRRGAALDETALRRDLARIGAEVWLVHRAAADMESTLLAFARTNGANATVSD